MHPRTLLSRVLTGALLANGIPHFINGISGSEFPTPFASPPGVGLSSPVVNVLWGAANFALACLLLAKSRRVTAVVSADASVIAASFIGTALALAAYFG